MVILTLYFMQRYKKKRWAGEGVHFMHGVHFGCMQIVILCPCSLADEVKVLVGKQLILIFGWLAVWSPANILPAMSCGYRRGICPAVLVLSVPAQGFPTGCGGHGEVTLMSQRGGLLFLRPRPRILMQTPGRKTGAEAGSARCHLGAAYGNDPF